MSALFDICHTSVEISGPASHETIFLPHITVWCAKCGSKKTVIRQARNFRFMHCDGVEEAIPNNIVLTFEQSMRRVFGTT